VILSEDEMERSKDPAIEYVIEWTWVIEWFGHLSSLLYAQLGWLRSESVDGLPGDRVVKSG